jgi:predicted Zn-dependent peptidase
MGAFTARRYTVYHATVLDEYLPFALEALGDMLCNSVLPEDALDTAFGHSQRNRRARIRSNLPIIY